MPFYPPLRIRRGDTADQKAWKRLTASKLLELRTELRKHTHGQAGICDYFQCVFRQGGDDKDGEDEQYYSPQVGGNVTCREWRTYQMSDHPPMWLELRVDFGDDYLQRIAGD
ncbi:MAG: hypothetical protein ABIF77_05070 [bacterium]